MYYRYFGLNQPPFRITPDTGLFFPGGNRGAVLEALVYAITNGEGIVKVVGEVGSGKTMLCRMLELELPKNAEIIYLVNPSLSPEEILHAIAFELSLRVNAANGRLRVMHILHDFLLKKHAKNQRVVMFVEEAQSMPTETLEEIRLLSNLETQYEKLLQIVLFAQPELDQTLARKEIRQLKERITYSFYLQPFTAEQIKDYTNSRLRATGYKGMGLFTPGAIRTIARYSQGLLRRINILADKAMLAAYANNAVTVTAKHVRMAVQDSELEHRWWRPRIAAAIAAGTLIVAGISGWLVYSEVLPGNLAMLLTPESREAPQLSDQQSNDEAMQMGSHENSSRRIGQYASPKLTVRATGKAPAGELARKHTPPLSGGDKRAPSPSPSLIKGEGR